MFLINLAPTTTTTTNFNLLPTPLSLTEQDVCDTQIPSYRVQYFSIGNVIQTTEEFKNLY